VGRVFVKVAELQGDVEKLLGVQQDLAAEKASHENVLTEMNRLVLEVRAMTVLPTSHLAAIIQVGTLKDGVDAIGGRCESSRLASSARTRRSRS